MTRPPLFVVSSTVWPAGSWPGPVPVSTPTTSSPIRSPSTPWSAAGLGVLSEESGHHHPERDIIVVVDPVDGSTNAAHGLPWWATSLCALDGDGPRVAVVVNQVTGDRYEAVRGGGARLNGTAIKPSTCTAMSRSIVALSGYAERHLGWEQYRALGAAALDLCAVAAGSLDVYIDCGTAALAPWDYLGALLVCREAGAFVADLQGRELVVRDHDARRKVVAAGTVGTARPRPSRPAVALA